MRRLIRWTSLAALTVLALPILHEFAIQHQLYDYRKRLHGKLLDSEAEPMSYRETGSMDGASTLFPDVFGD